MKTTRREVLTGIGAIGLTTAFVPNAHGQQSAMRHPFMGLTEILKRNGQIDLGGQFTPSGRYTLATFMTAQRMRDGCGTTFLEMNAVTKESECRLESIMIMPRFADQEVPSARRNLESALTQNSTIRVFSGSKSQITSIASGMNMGFTQDRSGKIIDHSPNVALLDASGRKLLEFDMTNPFEFRYKIREALHNGQMVSKCDGPLIS